MKYSTGLFGGSFDPLHLGHLRVIVRAASECEKLYIVLSYSRERDSIPMELRYRWLRNSLRHMPNIEILTLEDHAASKEEYDTDAYWEKGRDQILSLIGSPIRVVYCGSDYQSTRRYEKLYHCDCVYMDRSEVPVTSTQIRSDPFRYWDYIPAICRSWYVKKVLLVGGESTGKSTLAQNLALLFNTQFLEELGREVCDKAGGEERMIAGDFQEILLRHKLREQELLPLCNRLLFEDTDALTTQFFSRFLLTDADAVRTTDDLADAIAQINQYDLILFLEPTVAFVQDGTRNPLIEADREKYSRQLKAILDAHHMAYHTLSGDYAENLAQATCLIHTTFHI